MKHYGGLLMISSKKYVDMTLKNNHLVANKSLGQNFLINNDIVKATINALDLKKDDELLEIGPGLGALSEQILSNDCYLTAIEIDKNMVDILENTFSDNKKFTIVNQDILKFDIADFINHKTKKIKIVSNLPYYITSQILNKIILSDLDFDCFIAMMQKEVGKKIINPTRKDLNPLQVILQMEYEVSIVKYVSKNDFLPRPEVDSIILSFKKNKSSYLLNKQFFIEFLKFVFQNRRKTIIKNLSEKYPRDRLLDIFKKLNLSEDKRIDELDLQEIINLYNFLV